MARLDFSTALSMVELITGWTNKDALVKQGIQMSLDRISSAWSWPHLMENGFITTVAPYSTGTVSVTNGSATVTGSGTTFTSLMVGRKFRIGSESAYYKIKTFTDTTTIVLEAPYQGSTDSSLSYSIFQDEYRLPPDLDKLKIQKQIEHGKPLLELGDSAFDIIEPTPLTTGDPIWSIISGAQQDTYTTGTVTGTSGSASLTGTSTVWTSVQGLGRGSRLKIGSTVYTVKSVDSDTAITLYESLTAAASGASYTAILDNYVLQLFYIPDSVQNIYFRYQRQPYPLVGDQDVPDMPDNWHWLLILGACIWPQLIKDSQKAQLISQEFRLGMEEMKKSVGRIGITSTVSKQPFDHHRRLEHLIPYPGNYGVPIKKWF